MTKSFNITIITVVFNAEKLLERTIQSVLAQTYPSIEYIVIDGASTDGTLRIIQKYEDHIHQVISERDNGIYDAMNKGLARASGNYVLFLNAGDELYAPTTLEQVFAVATNADVYYGNTQVINEQGKVLGDRRHAPPLHLTWRSFSTGMSVSHQSFIAKRSLCEHYNVDYRIAADIDWVIAVLKKSKSIVNTHQYISKFLEGGTSAQTRSLALKERFRILLKYYGWPTTLISHLYIVFRFIIQKIIGKPMT